MAVVLPYPPTPAVATSEVKDKGDSALHLKLPTKYDAHQTKMAAARPS